jgi:hypothetical protein
VSLLEMPAEHRVGGQAGAIPGTQVTLGLWSMGNLATVRV